MWGRLTTTVALLATASLMAPEVVAYSCPPGYTTSAQHYFGGLRAGAGAAVKLGEPADPGDCSNEGASRRWNGTVFEYTGCSPRCCTCWKLSSSLLESAEQPVELLSASSGAALQGVYRAFSTIGDSPDAPGGLLVSMLDTTSTLAADEVSLHQMALWVGSCASYHGNTCLAFSYMRKDLPPMVYNYPSTVPQLRVGLLVDPDIASSLLTGMFVFDGDTNERQSCANEAGSNIDFSSKWTPEDKGPFACMKSAARAAGVEHGARVFQSTTDPGQKLFGGICDPRVEKCAFMNSGGCMSTEDFGNWPGCMDPHSPEFKDFESCFEFKKQNSSSWEVRFSGSCLPCSQPYVCDASASPGNAERVYDAAASEFKAYVGADGSGFPGLFMRPKMSRDGSNNAQCKWKRDSWSAWVGASRAALRDALSGALGEQGRWNGYAWADPAAEGAYFNNEVNAYVYPDASSSVYTDQNDVFMASIMGVVVDTQTCEEKLRFLNGVPSSGKGGVVYKDATSRCAAFRAAAKTTEQEEIAEAIKAAQHLARLIGPGTLVVQANFSTNAAPEPLVWRKALAKILRPEDFMRSF